MPSQIDNTKPTTGTATTQSVRDNFGFAKSEIEALEADIATETAERIAADAAEVTARDAAIAAAKEAIWPVGSIYISTTATNPNTLLGFGTWSAFGAGRVLVSQDAAQTEFNTLEETGGAKTHTLTAGEMPAHTHTQDAHTHTQDAHTHTQDPHTHTINMKGPSGPVTSISTTSSSPILDNTDTTTATNQNTTATNQNATATNQNTGGGGAHNNLQPYIVVSMWKRTA
jgi:microcystin-dependent protein